MKGLIAGFAVIWLFIASISVGAVAFMIWVIVKLLQFFGVI